MQKASILLLVVGILIALGIALSFYGSQIVTEGLETSETDLEAGGILEIPANLDPLVSDKGVFVVQIMEFKPSTIDARLFDSYGSQIVSKTIEKESHEEQFDITTAGQYKLIIENKGTEKHHVVGVLGHLPDKSKFAVGLTGFYILLVGLVGIVGIGVFAIKNRKKSS